MVVMKHTRGKNPLITEAKEHQIAVLNFDNPKLKNLASRKTKAGKFLFSFSLMIFFRKFFYENLDLSTGRVASLILLSIEILKLKWNLKKENSMLS